MMNIKVHMLVIYIFLDKMSVLIFSTNFVCNIPHSKQNSARYHKCTHVVILVILMQVAIYRLEQYSNIKFNENPSNGNPAVP
jgi:hypothetical protein